MVKYSSSHELTGINKIISDNESFYLYRHNFG